MKEHMIYKYVNHDVVIYIGKTDSSLYNRIKGHEKEERFKPYMKNTQIYFFRCNNRAETTVYETALINKYKPILNIQSKYEDTRDFNLIEPEWTMIKEYEEDDVIHMKERSYHNAALSRIDGVLTGHCILCGEYIGNEKDTSIYSLIRKKYCPKCAKLNDKKTGYDRSKKFTQNRRQTIKEMRELIDYYKISYRLQKEYIEVLEKENKNLKAELERKLDDQKRGII